MLKRQCPSLSSHLNGKGGHRPVIPVPLPRGPGIPIYTLSCSSILATRETRGRAQSSRDGPPAQRQSEPPSRDPCKMSVDRTHRKRQPHCCTHRTGATDTPIFLVWEEGGREGVVSAWGWGAHTAMLFSDCALQRNDTWNMLSPTDVSQLEPSAKGASYLPV